MQSPHSHFAGNPLIVLTMAAEANGNGAELKALRAEFFHAMPKVELHSHLGGSIRPATIDALMIEKGLSGLSCSYDEKSASATPKEDESRMHHCFKMFDAVYKVTDNLAAIRRIAKEVVEDYSAENTKLLELRTSLKDLEGKGEEAYLDAVIEGLADGNAALPPSKRVVTKVLVSVNRGAAVEAAVRAVDLAVAYLAKSTRSEGVCGVELSGNCYKGAFTELEPQLRRAREAGLPVSLHVGEKDDEEELDAMLEFRPDRIGHLVFSKEKTQAKVKAYKIPIEMCITSNLITSNWKPEEHHVSDWVHTHPVSINTDDRGIFGITMASEFALLQEICNLSNLEVFNIARAAIDVCLVVLCCRLCRTPLPKQHSFASDEDRALLHTQFDDFRKENPRYFTH